MRSEAMVICCIGIWGLAACRPPVARAPTQPPPAVQPSETAAAAPTSTVAAPASPQAPTATKAASSLPPTLQPQEPSPPPFPLSAPILPPGRDVIDPSYPFASTQGGEREPHHGVEFLNSFGTPVAAAADGRVVYAGNDDNGSPYGPSGWFAFYGLFVILEHAAPGHDLPIYSLYAHLSEIHVAAGDQVQQGQTLGRVGFTGAAVGSHLHFEVRYGENTYAAVSNPVLWLRPQEGSGSLAGAIVDAAGLDLPVIALQLTALDTGYTQYFSTYEDPSVTRRAPFFETFALGNLPAGIYELAFVAYGLEKHLVEIRPGELTYVEITVGAPE